MMRADDPERDAIATEPPAAVVEGCEAVRELAVTLARPGIVANVTRLRTARTRLEIHNAAERRARDLAELARLGHDIGRERDPEKVAQRFAEAEAIAARLGPIPHTYSATDVLRDTREIPFLCRALQLAPGRPPVFIGYAGDGKTTAAIAAGAAWAIGRHAWGCEQIKASRVLRVAHVDLDMGGDAARARVREVLCAEQITEDDLRGATLDVIDGKRRGLALRCTGPRDVPTEADVSAYLAAWRDVLMVYDLAIVDNLRKLGPMLNFDGDPRAAIVLDLLAEASSETGSVPWILGHSPKGQNRGPHQALKGRADLEGASGGNVCLWKDEEGRRHLELTRGAELSWRPLLGYLDMRESGALVFTPNDAARFVSKPAPSKGGRKRADDATPEQKIVRAFRDATEPLRTAEDIAEAAHVRKATVLDFIRDGGAVMVDGAYKLAGPAIDTPPGSVPGSRFPPAPLKGAEPEPKRELEPRGAPEAIRDVLSKGTVPTYEALVYRVGKPAPSGLKGAWDDMRHKGEVVKVGNGWGLPTLPSTVGEGHAPSEDVALARAMLDKQPDIGRNKLADALKEAHGWTRKRARRAAAEVV